MARPSTSERHPGWLSWTGAEQVRGKSRLTIAAEALRGLIRTRVHGDHVLFNRDDVAALARGDEQAA